jgi:polyhydroxyalkanoate synthase
MPSTVDRSGFVIGKNMAATPGAVVYRDEVCEVLQYTPSTATLYTRPVLLIPPQIGRYYFMDLTPGRSFVEHAVAHGIPFFLVSWRNPSAEHADWGFDTYAAAVDRVIDIVRDVSRCDEVNLLSLCAGGILTAGLLSHLAAGGDTRVRSASFGVTLLDFA